MRVTSHSGKQGLAKKEERRGFKGRLTVTSPTNHQRVVRVSYTYLFRCRRYNPHDLTRNRGIDIRSPKFVGTNLSSDQRFRQKPVCP